MRWDWAKRCRRWRFFNLIAVLAGSGAFARGFRLTSLVSNCGGGSQVYSRFVRARCMACNVIRSLTKLVRRTWW